MEQQQQLKSMEQQQLPAQWPGSVLMCPSPLPLQPVRTFSAPAFFTFHYVNAFESADGQQLHMDMGVYDGPEIVNDLYLDRLAAYPGGLRWQARWAAPIEAEGLGAGAWVCGCVGAAFCTVTCTRLWSAVAWSRIWYRTAGWLAAWSVRHAHEQDAAGVNPGNARRLMCTIG
jgi:hypothetical protein